ncbi:hypothetical protein LCGC14_1065690 [marine sediment metagenome]|uniref:Uncharacterized protein n=1 Tax=marine sediment metagenome TaxID=412755 RepID=A0A0F9QQI1_9ZZZZ
MNSMSDQISNLSDEDQQRFHEYTQRSLRKQWAKARQQTEKEIDDDRKCKGS